MPRSPLTVRRWDTGTTTPSCRAASWIKSRPFSGKSRTCWLSTSADTLAEVVSISDTSAETTTCSLISPTLRVTPSTAT